jgi:3-dehydroquinate synthase
MSQLHVQTAGHTAPTYEAFVRSNALSELPKILASLGSIDRIAIIYDSKMESYARKAAESLQNAVLIAVPSGESSKTMQMAETIIAQLLAARMSRKSVIIAIGGGMLTDLAGFVGSIYLRGIRTLLIPTSLLCMVDAALGGKTAVDCGTTKNAIGTIHQPCAVICDLSALDTLPQSAYCDGLVEVVKMAAILDAECFEWIEANITKILARDPSALEKCVTKALQMKADVIKEDSRDNGIRLYLNFGHTIGHAVEALSEFTISHGQAVAIGMVAEMHAAGFQNSERVTTLLTQLDVPQAIPSHMKKEALWELMLQDKKTSDGIVYMAVPTALGKGNMVVLTKEQFWALA